jgi:hypothetical protein
MELEAGRVKAARHASARTPAQVVFLPSGMQPCDCHALQTILSEEWCCEEVAHLFRQDRSCADYKTDYIAAGRCVDRNREFKALLDILG